MSDEIFAADLDCRGLACPVPVLELAKVARDAAPGTRLRMVSDDPAARTDVAVWCRMKRHTLDRIAVDGRALTFEVTVGG